MTLNLTLVLHLTVCFEWQMDSRDKTLSALEAYILAQQTLLDRTQEDIARLKQLKQQAVEAPDAILDNVIEKIQGPSFKLSTQASALLEAGQLPDVDWQLLQCRNPTPFTSLVQKYRRIPPLGAPDANVDGTSLAAASLYRKQSHTSPPLNLNQQPTRSTSTLVKTPLQIYVHESARNLLGVLRPLSPSPPPSPPLVSEEKCLTNSASAKKADIAGDNSIVANGVTLRRTTRKHKPKMKGYGRESPEQERPCTSRGKSGSFWSKNGATNGHRRSNSTTTRQSYSPTLSRASRAFSVSHTVSTTPTGERDWMDAHEKEEAVENSVNGDGLANGLIGPSTVAATTASRKPRKKREPNETYNLPWSIEEHHLLERLLTEIPHGEKQRWLRISQAMSGRRTPKQVASRVQKWFAKLKKSGIDPG